MFNLDTGLHVCWIIHVVWITNKITFPRFASVLWLRKAFEVTDIEVLYSTANDPETANNPQNGPQMILDRKWSPKSTANDPERKIGMAWINCVNFVIISKSQTKAKFYFSIKYYTWTRETWIKTKWKNHSSVKTGSATHDFYLMPKCLFKWVFSLPGRLCSGGKRFATYSILRGHDTHIDFLQLLFLVGMISL